jgi:hypothetical protein
MLTAAAERLTAEADAGHVDFVLAPMSPLPFASKAFDFVVAHGIWNLARSDREFTEAVKEAGRVARLGALLFVFTFSRHTLADSAAPVAGGSLVFTQFSGQRQCFVTEDQLQRSLAEAGFVPEAAHSLRQLNRAPEGLRTGNTPVIGCGRRSRWSTRLADHITAWGSHARGLYEVPITEAIEAQLRDLDNSLHAARSGLRAAEAPDRLALHLGRLIQRAVAGLDEAERVEKGIALARSLVAQIDQAVTDGSLAPDAPLAPGTAASLRLSNP